MKVKISELLEQVDPFAASAGIDMRSDFSAISAERIKEKTMEKIGNKGKTRKHFKRTVLLAAVLAAMLTITAAALVSGHIHVRQAESGETFADGKAIYTPPTGASIVTMDATAGEHRVCFQYGWLPEDATHLYDDVTQNTSSARLDWIMKEYAKENHMQLKKVEQLSGMTMEEAQSWYGGIQACEIVNCGMDNGRFFRIEIYSGAALNDMNLVNENGLTVVKEGNVHGYQGTYLTEASGEVMNNYLLLYSEEMKCYVCIMGHITFEEMERIAEGLTLRETGLPAPSFGNAFSMFMVGVG